jgi:hypothetical protein
MNGDRIELESDRESVATAVMNSSYTLTQEEADTGTWLGRVRLQGHFLGQYLDRSPFYLSSL